VVIVGVAGAFLVVEKLDRAYSPKEMRFGGCMLCVCVCVCGDVVRCWLLSGERKISEKANKNRKITVNVTHQF